MLFHTNRATPLAYSTEFGQPVHMKLDGYSTANWTAAELLRSCAWITFYWPLAPQQNCQECHGYPVRRLHHLSSLPWNHCPVSRGISVQFAVEWLSSLVWNTQPRCQSDLRERTAQVCCFNFDGLPFWISTDSNGHDVRVRRIMMRTDRRVF